ncbi:sensor histidine kinase [Patescibacteria group bacterium]
MEEQKDSLIKKESILPDAKKVASWRHSIFAKFFSTFLLLALVPAIIAIVLLVSAYQSLLSRYVSEEIVSDFFNNITTQIILVFLFIVVVAIFVAFVLSRNITRPLRSLTSAVERIAKGDLNISFNVTRMDEIGTLAYFFNDMVVRLKEVIERQKVISRMKSEFVSIAAHQLRTPLSAMKWSIRMVLDGEMGPIKKDVNDILSRSYQVNERMIVLVDSLLNVARLEEGRFGFDFIKIGINDLLQDVAVSYKLFAERKGVILNFQFSQTRYVILADKDKLSLAIGNIIDNAIRYTPKNGMVNISIDKEKDKYIIIKVQDTGMGIPKRHHEKMFTKFFRSKHAALLETEGTGLGLYIARNIFIQHGGDIRFESAENKGTTFFIKIPLRPELVPKEEKPLEEFLEKL